MNVKKYAIPLVIYLLWFAAVFDPIGNVFFLRYIAWAASISLLLILGLYLQLFNSKNLLKKSLLIYVAILMPIYGITLCLINNGLGTEFRDTSYIAAGVLLLFSLIYFDKDQVKTAINAMIFPLRCLSILTIIIYIAMTSDLDIELLSFFTEKSVAVFGFREYAGIQFPYIYFLASPMLAYLIGYDLNKVFSNFNFRYMLICFLSILAYAFSGTRAHQLLALVYAPLFYILLYSRHKILLLYFSILSVAIIFSIFDFEILDLMFSPKETSNSMKIAMLDVYAEIFNNPIMLIFGQGYNAHTWSLPFMKMLGVPDGATTSKTELTYIELIRVYGILVSVPFYALLTVLVYRLAWTSEKYKWLLPAFLIHLADSATNPYIFSTNGMLPLGLIIAVVSLKGESKHVMSKRLGRAG